MSEEENTLFTLSWKEQNCYEIPWRYTPWIYCYVHILNFNTKFGSEIFLAQRKADAELIKDISKRYIVVP